MGLNFEELDHRRTRLGELSLRRRRLPAVGDEDIYEVKLGDEFLMSSLFTEAEVALAQLALKDLTHEMDVVVGGLGLAYTAAAALEFSNVSSVLVIEGLAPVIDWHRQGLLPLGAKLTSDPRCRLVEGDFFDLAGRHNTGFDPQQADRRFHAILLDIDHSPSQVLNAAHQPYYDSEGLQQLKRHLLPGGVYALWSNDPADAHFLQTLRSVFATVTHHVISFDNPLQGTTSSNTVYIAQC